MFLFPAILQSDVEDFEEAGNEIMLLDEETVPYVVGETFVHLPREEVEERLQRGESSGAPVLSLCCWEAGRAARG